MLGSASRSCRHLSAQRLPSGELFRASFASLTGFVFFLVLTAGRGVSQRSTDPARAAAPQQLPGFSGLFVLPSITSVCSPAVSVNPELRQLVTHLFPLPIEPG